MKAALRLSLLGLACSVWALAALAQDVVDSGVKGDAQRGRARLLARHDSGCILCHTVPGLAQGGNLGPALDNLAARFTALELSARIADARRFNPDTIMPPTRSTTGLQHVAPAYVGQTLLSEQALQDIVAYLLRPADAPR